jgi:hypothetical protein
MGNATTYSGVMGGLGRLISALNANAVDLPYLDGARPRLAKIATDMAGPFRGRKPQTPKTSTPSEPTAPAPTLAPPAARLAADANSK